MRAYSALDAVVISAAARYLASWLSTVPPERLAEWARNREDLVARIPSQFDLPNVGLSRPLLVRYLRHSVDEDWYEALRLQLSRYLPVHAALLGLEEVRPWYLRQMEALRCRLVAHFSDEVSADVSRSEDCSGPRIGWAYSRGDGTNLLARN